MALNQNLVCAFSQNTEAKKQEKKAEEISNKNDTTTVFHDYTIQCNWSLFFNNNSKIIHAFLLIWATENNFYNIKLYIFRRKQPQPKHTYLKNRKSII